MHYERWFGESSTATSSYDSATSTGGVGTWVAGEGHNDDGHRRQRHEFNGAAGSGAGHGEARAWQHWASRHVVGRAGEATVSVAGFKRRGRQARLTGSRMGRAMGSGWSWGRATGRRCQGGDGRMRTKENNACVAREVPVVLDGCFDGRRGVGRRGRGSRAGATRRRRGRGGREPVGGRVAKHRRSGLHLQW